MGIVDFVTGKYARAVAYGFILGTAGVRILSSKDAKKAYTHITAAGLRCKTEVIKTGNKIKENCEDILADAKDINEERYEKEREAEIADARALLDELEVTAKEAE